MAAFAEGWRLEDPGPGRKELVLGNESWPFPVPLVKEPTGWSFDAAAGKEEVLNRRIGRNELAVIRVLHDYVAAQRAYAATGHDGKPAGLYARRFASDPGKQNGLYWPARRGEPRSPLGILVARGRGAGLQAPRRRAVPVPRLLLPHPRGPGQGREGRRREYVVNGQMTGGFALVAWPVHYDASGMMTFIVNQDGVAHEKDLGPETPAASSRSRATTPTRPGAPWRPSPASAEAAPADRRQRRSRGCPVDASTLVQSSPSGSISCARRPRAAIGTCVNWWFQ